MVTWASVEEAQEWLTGSIDALEQGNWRLALQLCGGDVVATEFGLVELGLLLSAAATSIYSLGIGDVSAARRQLSAGAGMLPPFLRRAGADGHVLANLVPRPSSAQPLRSVLAWRAARILWREQCLIAELLNRLREHDSPRDHLVEAYIQRMGEVEFSPFSWYRPARPTPRPRRKPVDPSVTLTRLDMLLRASRLRKLALPEAGDVSQSPWHDIGGPRGLRAEALSRLASRPEPLGPETKHLSDPIPIRLGHLRAWEYARQWRIDVGHAESDRQ
jgi:hypothetical protein